jgi:hypothetical protein
LQQQRIIGRVIGGVAEAGNRKHRDKDRVRMYDARYRKCGRAQRDTRYQHNTRANVVDQKSRGRLQRSGDDIERRQRQPEISVTDPIIRLDEGEQRRQDDHVIMAHKVSRADRRNDAPFAKARCWS